MATETKEEVLDWDNIKKNVMHYKTKIQQFKKLQDELKPHFDDDEKRLKITRQKMKEWTAHKKYSYMYGTCEIIWRGCMVVSEQKSPSERRAELLNNIDKLICFVDDFNFSDIEYDDDEKKHDPEKKNAKIFIPSIKYYRQSNNWTCGPANIRMILESLLNKKYTEQQLIKILNTNSIDGTLQKDMISIGDNDIFKDLLECQYGDYGNIEKLKGLTKNGWLCIVEWSLNDCPHYSLFSHDDGYNVYLNDPWFGELYKVEKYDFIRRWNVYKKNFIGQDFELNDRESCRFYLAFRNKSN